MRALLLLALALQLPLQEAVTLVRQGHYQEADQKLRAQPEPAEANQRIAYHRLKAAIDAGLHHLPEAAVEMKQALALAPDNNDLAVATAFALVQSGSNDEAIRLLKAARDSAITATLEGIASYALGEFQDAETALHHAIQLDTKFEPAYRSLAQIALASSSTPSATTISSLCPWDRIVCAALQLREARQTGDQSKQRASMEVLKQAPAANAVARCALGQADSWASDWNAARPQLESCVKLDPSPQHHYQLAMAYQHLGAKQLARQELAARAKLLGKQTEEAVAGKQALEDWKRR